MSSPSFGNRFATGSIIAFGAWTGLAQGMVAAGGDLHQLAVGAALLVIILAGASARERRHRQPSLEAQPNTAADFFPAPSAPTPRRMAFAVYLLAMATLALLAIFVTPETMALALAVIAGGVFLTEVRRPATEVRPLASRSWERALIAFAFCVALLSISVHRPDADDAMYINMATTAADFPNTELLSFDGTLPDSEVPLPEPAYRAHSLELLAGLLAYISGLPAIGILHLGIAFWAALLAVFGQAELQKVLMPRHWLVGTLLTILLFLALGETHRAYGNFAIVRIHQGKGILVAAILPLLVTYAIHFMRAPSAKGWAVLLLAMVAASGVSSSGIVIGPLAAGLALLSAWAPDRRSTTNLILGLATSLYPIGVAFTLGLL